MIKTTTRAGLLAGSILTGSVVSGTMLAMSMGAILLAPWTPAWADGGSGGGFGGGSGGTDSATGSGGGGIGGPVGIPPVTGGGGGGAGDVGGAGGTGAGPLIGLPGSFGGAGGAAAVGGIGGDGQAGGDQLSIGGAGGGGGGAHGFVSAIGNPLPPTPAVRGGNGGNGGAASIGIGGAGANGGGGGAGGYGGVISSGGALGLFSLEATGGAGGNAGSGDWGAAGGSGGAGLVFTVPATGLMTVTNHASGGNGGNGGDALNDGGAGGAGGAGIQGSGSGNNLAFTVGHGVTVSGGNGGTGGFTAGFDPTQTGGRGGNGGIGISGNGLIIDNAGVIRGGNGGTGGEGRMNGHGGTGGDAGAAISGSNLTITNSGTISAGTAGAGGVSNLGSVDGAAGHDANAITFTGGTNTLALEAGSTIIGKVVAVSGGQDTLMLGGTADSSFNASTLGTQYLNFANFVKTDSSKWTLTGTDAAGRGWTVLAGTLSGTTDSLKGNIGTGSGATVEINQMPNGVYAGNIGGAGSFVKSGGGMVTLTGFNTYSGGTTVLGGQLIGDTRSLQGNINISASGLSGFVQNTDGTYAGVLSGSGLFGKGGTGTVIMTADSSGFQGATLAAEGTLQVGDAAHAAAKLGGDVNVLNTGTLAGHGTVLGNVDNTMGGVVAPGGSAASGSIGTLHVGGSYAQGTNSTLNIRVSPAAASQLAVGGTADLGGGKLALSFAPGVYTSRSYTIVQANQVTNTFGTVTQSGVAGLDPHVSYTTQTVLLSVTGNGNGFTVAPTNGQVISATTSSLVLGSQAASRALFGHLSDRRGGGDSGSDDTMRTAFSGNNPNQASFGGDLSGLNAIAQALPEALAKHGGWFRATGGFGSIDGGSLQDVDSHGGGFMAGYDYHLTDQVLIGGAVGYSRTAVSQGDGSAEINTPRVMVYGSYQLGNLALDGSLGYAYDRIKTRNASEGGTATSQHDAHEISAGLQASYLVELPQKIALTPRVGLDYLHLFEEGFTEKGAGDFDLTTKSGEMDSLKPSVGVSLARTFETDGGTRLTPQLDLTYSHEVLDNGRNAQVVIGGGAFTVDGVKPSRDELALGVSLTASLTHSFDLYGGYTALLPVGNTISHNFEAGLRVTF